MSIVILFGLPGTGKTYVGKILKKYFDYFFYEGDEDLTNEMKTAIKKQEVFTDQMRDKYFEKLINRILKLKSEHKKLAVAQTFIKEKYRINLINKIPEIKFILIETKKNTREKRLNERCDYPLEIEYSRKMCKNFEEPKVNHQIIINNQDGDKTIKAQINFLLCNVRQ
jgi:gluconate kinase